jgi:hypothetical protein
MFPGLNHLNLVDRRVAGADHLFRACLPGSLDRVLRAEAGDRTMRELITVDRWFQAYGVRVGIRTDDPAVLDRLDADGVRVLPYGWRPYTDTDCHGAAVYDICLAAPRGARPRYRLEVGGRRAANGVDLDGVLRVFAAHAELLVAERAPDHLFVHAGVVAWHGRAVLLPGSSGAGKTSLVRACLAAGATYYSDEYAVLDREGRVHPYTRPLAIRSTSGGSVRHVPAEVFGAAVGREPTPVGLVLVTAYRAGALWRPRLLTPARAVLALMAHAVAAQGCPAHSMPILKEAVAPARVLASPRGEAGAVASDLEAHLTHEPRQGPMSTPVPVWATSHSASSLKSHTA